MHARLALLVALLTACSDRSASMKQPLSPDVENIRLSPDGEDLKRAQECVPPLCHDHDACAREAIAEITALTCKPLAKLRNLVQFPGENLVAREAAGLNAVEEKFGAALYSQRGVAQGLRR
jgi:hypothetical protein